MAALAIPDTRDLHRLPTLLPHLPDGPVGTEERVLPLIVTRSLMQKILIAIVYAAAEIIVHATNKRGK